MDHAVGVLERGSELTEGEQGGVDLLGFVGKLLEFKALLATVTAGHQDDDPFLEFVADEPDWLDHIDVGAEGSALDHGMGLERARAALGRLCCPTGEPDGGVSIDILYERWSQSRWFANNIRLISILMTNK